MYTASWDKAYIQAHRGDAAAPDGKPKVLGVFDGMLQYLDPRHEGWTELPVFSDEHLTEAIVFEVERSLLPALIAGTAQVNQPVVDMESSEPVVYPDGYRYTSKYLDWGVLEPYVIAQCPDFKNLLYEKDAKIPVLKVPFFPMTALKDSTTIDVNRDPSLRPEVGALLPGNYTVGVAGAYLTFGGAAGAYVANNAGGAMTGDVTMTEISNIVETATALATQTLGGFTWLTTSDNPHYGDPTAGWLIQENFQAIMFDWSEEGPGVMEIEHIHTIRTANYAGGNYTFWLRNAINPHTANIHDFLIDGNGSRERQGTIIAANAPVPRLWNIVVWECDNVGISAASANALIENCAVYLCSGINGGAGAGYALGNVACTCRNSTAYDNTVDFLNIAAATGRFCRSSDLTAADVNWAAGLGNTINAVVLNDVQGVNDAVANYFDIIAAGPLDGAGEANVIAARVLCIRNRAVPGPNGTSVGPAEIPVPVAPTPTARDVATTQSHVAMPGAIAMY